MTTEGDVLLSAPVEFGIEVIGGVVTMTGGFETAVGLSLFGGNVDDDGSTGTESKQWWGNLLETEPEFIYRSRTQSLIDGLPATSGNLVLIEEAATLDLKWMLDIGIASTVTVAARLVAVNRLALVVSIFAEGVEHNFTFTKNWGAASDQASVDSFVAAV